MISGGLVAVEVPGVDHAGEGEVEISTARPDGSLRSYVPIWIVRVGDELYVRSYRGESGSWYRHARRDPRGRLRTAGIDSDVEFTEPGETPVDVVDQAYRDKYGAHGGSYVNTMTRDDVAATTLRLTRR